jgi:enamine deaminase RidA (YjgF/YER057c/UK114 family)
MDAGPLGICGMIDSMEISAIDPSSVPVAVGGYVNGLDVRGAQRLLFISGQIPQDREGRIPDGIEDQCRLVWANLTAVLRDAGMEVTNLVKVTTFLSDRAHAAVNTAVRNEVLGAHRPALTVVLAGIWDPAWLIEIEAIAASS